MTDFCYIYLFTAHRKEGGKSNNCLRYNSNIWGHKAAGNKKPPRNIAGLYRRHVYEVELESNFAGIPAVKTDMASVAGDFCSHVSYVAGSSAASRPGRHLQIRGGRCWRATKVVPSTGTRGGGWGDEGLKQKDFKASCPLRTYESSEESKGLESHSVLRYLCMQWELLILFQLH